MAELSPEQQVAKIYSILFRAWGRQHWWPAQSRFEVIVGAYLTQNTSWSNVEIAMKQLRMARVLNVDSIRNISVRKLEKFIRSSGYFRQKASRLKTFIKFLDQNYGGSLTRMFAQPTEKLREELLALNGVGPETADSILLYGGQHATFVVDAYTRRLASRHEIATEKASYEELRAIFGQALIEYASPAALTHSTDMSDFPPGKSDEDLRSRPRGTSHSPSRMSLARRAPLAQVFNEMHGLIVGIGKNYCLKSKPRCDECPLKHLLPGKGQASEPLRPKPPKPENWQ